MQPYLTSVSSHRRTYPPRSIFRTLNLFSELITMASPVNDDASISAPPIIHTRAYQQELLEESLRRNLIIALDTGSGKTHISVLRMKHETERQSRKVRSVHTRPVLQILIATFGEVSWFIAPTVALVEQQYDVIKTAIPVSVGLVSGASEPNQWKDASLWRRILASHRIMVTTPQVLLDALHHVSACIQLVTTLQDSGSAFRRTLTWVATSV